MKKLFMVLFLALGITACSRSQERVTPATLQNCDNIDVVKDALVNYVIYSGNLEKSNSQMNQVLQRLAMDLRKVQTVAQLDSVCKVYGIPREVKTVGDKRKP